MMGNMFGVGLIALVEGKKEQILEEISKAVSFNKELDPEKDRDSLEEFEHPSKLCPPDTRYCWIRYSANIIPDSDTVREGRSNLEEAAKNGWRPVSFKENPHLMTKGKRIYSYGDYIMYMGSLLCQKSTLKQLENVREFKTMLLPDNTEIKLLDLAGSDLSTGL
jgi:hypothetical protein